MCVHMVDPVQSRVDASSPRRAPSAISHPVPPSRIGHTMCRFVHYHEPSANLLQIFHLLSAIQDRRKTSNTHHVDNTVLEKIKLASSSSNPAPFHSVAIVQCIDISEVEQRNEKSITVLLSCNPTTCGKLRGYSESANN